MGYFRCWSARNVLDLYADGRLTERATARVRAHLGHCASCRELMGGVGSVADLLKGAAVPVPAGLAESILRRLDEEADAPALRTAPWRLTPAQAAAFVYLVVLAGSSLAPGAPSQGRGVSLPPAMEVQ